MNLSDKVSGSGNPCPDDSTGLQAYACFYFTIHGYLSLAICCFGVPTNIINVIILTQKKLRSPINTVLTGIAVSDILTMVCYIPFAIHFNIMHGPERTPEKYTYGWNWFLVIHSGLSLTTNTISVWLGVCMAVMRFVFIRSMGRGTNTITIPVSIFIVIAVFVFSIMTYIPNYIFMKVMREPVNITKTNTTRYDYRIRNMRLGAEDETALEATAAWLHIIVGQLLPCILIVVFGGLLLLTLQESKKRTIMLKGGNIDSRLKQHKRTTVMLLTIILMTIIAELPSSILVVIGLTVESFFETEYMYLADTLDMIALINSAINFILYCAMSKQFRDCLCDYTCNLAPDKSGKIYRAILGKTTSNI